MTAEEKIEKITELTKEKDSWQAFADSMSIMLVDKERGIKNYRSLTFRIKKLFGKSCEISQFENIRVNARTELLQLNYDYATNEVCRIDKEILAL